MSTVNEDKLRAYLRKLIEQTLEETSSTGGIAGYETPFAFNKDGKTRKIYDPNYTEVDDILESADGTIENVEGEPAVPAEVAPVNATPTPQRIVASYVKEINQKLDEISSIISKTVKTKTEHNLGTDDYWKRTNKALYRINEKLIKLSGKIKDLC